ncbi:MAG TPA: TMEM175 family protein [Atribacter sp.]|jgi:uncharacterized membrane protein|uniref:TMEM175 family protein n=1 Tax=Atribacter sp. TaxID=2847780 RepID=UPI0017596B45|nr:TMEM175 family protein [Atribacter sp.]HHT09586.1 DUF1211 domain-containing protein [Candidatus Atribacteria bacterium]HQK82824.1 TMEM175 family protein [Atribacter sp.]
MSQDKFELSIERIQSLTDGIFAFAMTLLVINIDLPSTPHKIDPELLGKYLFSLWPDFFHYVLSFILLSLFWVEHHQQFYYIKKINRKALWINILNLLFVALFPFSTSLMGDYSSQSIAAAFFISNLLVIKIFLYLNWVNAISNKELIVSDINEEIIFEKKSHHLFFIITSLIGLVLAFIIPEWSTLPFVLTFFHRSILKNKKKLYNK